MSAPLPAKFLFGGVDCSPHTIPQLLDEVRALRRDKSLQPRTLLNLNVHIFNLAADDAELRRRLNAARVVVADGMGVVWAARIFGVRLAERCNMTEAFRAFLTAPQVPDSTAILIGCSPAEAAAAAAAINRRSPHCRVLESCSGFLSDAEYREICTRHRNVDFILLGMGTPRTEAVTELAAAACPEAIVWGIGGGTIRILAGAIPEAPALLRRLGLQWLFRLAVEPVALWRRYLIGNPQFLLRVGRAAWRRRR